MIAAIFPALTIFAAVGLLVLSADRGHTKRTAYELVFIAGVVLGAAIPLLLLTL